MNQPFAFNKGKPITTERAGVTVTKTGDTSAPKSAASICVARCQTSSSKQSKPLSLSTS